MSSVKVNSRCYAHSSPVSGKSAAELVGKQMDALARRFHETHDMAVKEKLERLLRKYEKLKQPWKFVSR